MSELVEQKCVPCEGNVQPLSDQDIEIMQTQVPGWDVVTEDGSKRLRKVYKFKDFVTAMDFANRVGQVAEEQGHHPLICTTWGETTIFWWTHAIDGLHQNDFVMAARTEQAAAAMS
ncbi:MAG: 4a-hydroxytetrahydrobiopterin dehydratase [Cyanobacteria bacterium P01_H01_bin.121]